MLADRMRAAASLGLQITQWDFGNDDGISIGQTNTRINATLCSWL